MRDAHPSRLRPRLPTLLLVAALTFATALAGQTAALAAPRQVTVSSQYGPDKPQSLVWTFLAEQLEERLPGAFDLNIVTSGALGGEKQEAEGVRLGAIQGALSTLANLTTWVPEGALFDMPFLFRDADHIEEVLAGPIGDDLRAAYRAQGFHVLGFIVFGARHVIGDRAYPTPEAVEGETMRVLESELHVDLWRSLGADPTAIPITEAYNALATGLVDMMDMTKSGFHALKLYEVAPDLTETAHIWAVGVLYVGTDFFSSLSPEEQAVWTEAGAAAADHFDELAAAEQERALAIAVENGARVHAADRATWQAAMADFWDRWADRVGGEALIESVRAAGGEDVGGEGRADASPE